MYILDDEEVEVTWARSSQHTESLDDTLPFAVAEVNVHRGNVLEELITYFLINKKEIQVHQAGNQNDSS